MASFFDRLKQRKLFQWGLAYLAGAWVVFEVTDAVGGRWNLPDVVFQALFIFLVIGFLITLMLAWLHGEKGRQWVSGPELLVLTLLLAIGGFAVSRLESWSASPEEGTREGIAVLDQGPLALSSLNDPAVAVLPFAILGSEENEGFADGMHEEVLHSLAQVSGLLVKSRQSVLQYRGSRQPMSEIARDLGADAVLEGSVRAVGDRIRMTFQLIEARSDAHLWSKTFDRILSADQLFTIQEEVAREIARALQVSLTSDDATRLGHRPTQSLDARTVYLQALAAQRISDSETRRLLHLAIAMDSTYDRPWGLLAELAGSEAFATNDPALADSAIALARKAIELDPTQSSGDPYNALGFARMSQGRLSEARAAIWTGMQRNPNDPALANNFGILHAAAGLFPEAIAAFRRGIEISPAHIVNRTSLSFVYAMLGLHDRAEHMLDQARALQPAHYSVATTSIYLEAVRGDPEAALIAFSEWERATNRSLREDQLRTGAAVAAWAGDFVQARDFATLAYESEPDVLPLLGGHMAGVLLGFLQFIDGDSTDAEAHLAEAYRGVEPLVSRGSEFPQLSVELAAIEAIRGNVRESVRWFEQAYEFGYRDHQEIDLDPLFDTLRRDPEFERIMSLIRADVDAMREQVLAMESVLEADPSPRPF